MFSEIELIDRIKSGEEKAFEFAFKTYYPVLSVFAKKYVYDMDIGKEIVQDLFVKLYENKASLQVTSSLKSYLFKSVHNRCLTYISQNNLRARHLENVAFLHKDNVIESVDVMEQAELEEQIFNLVSALPDQCQKIFKMSRMEGKKNKEIAEELNLSIRTVETQISKALKVLREKLNHYLLIITLLLHFI